MPGPKLNNKNFYIKENSPFAWLAAKKMGTGSIAMVLGKTIHLHNISKQDFLQNNKLLKHELCHVSQYQRYGYIRFLIKYIWESMRKGYYNNKFEIEARLAEES